MRNKAMIFKKCVTCKKPIDVVLVFGDGECLHCKNHAMKSEAAKSELEIGVKRVYAYSELELKAQYPGVKGVRPMRPGSKQFTGTIFI